MGGFPIMAAVWFAREAILLCVFLLLSGLPATSSLRVRGGGGQHLGNDLKRTGADQANLIFEAMRLINSNSTTTTTTAKSTTTKSTGDFISTGGGKLAVPSAGKAPAETKASVDIAFQDVIYDLVRNMQLNATHIKDSVQNAVNEELPEILKYHDETVQKELLPHLDAMIHSALRDELKRHDKEVHTAHWRIFVCVLVYECNIFLCPSPLTVHPFVNLHCNNRILLHIIYGLCMGRLSTALLLRRRTTCAAKSSAWRKIWKPR